MATPTPGTTLDEILYLEDLKRAQLRDVTMDPADQVLQRDHAANPHLGAPLAPITRANEIDDFDFAR